jgi:hypothetical protein
MLAPTIALFFLLAERPVSADSTASRQIAAPCRLIEDNAIQYLKDHGFYTISATKDGEVLIQLGIRKDAATPSAKPPSLNRFSIHKYTLPRHLSPLKTYDFRLEGHLKLAKATEGSCNATLRFEISAYEDGPSLRLTMVTVHSSSRTEHLSDSTSTQSAISSQQPSVDSKQAGGTGTSVLFAVNDEQVDLILILRTWPARHRYSSNPRRAQSPSTQLKSVNSTFPGWLSTVDSNSTFGI